jgi:hypothetical protein
LSGTNQIPAELIQTGGTTLRSVVDKLINCIWNNDELPQQWMKLTGNYREMPLLPTTYKTVTNIIVSSLIPYVEESTGDHDCGIPRNGSTTDQIHRFRLILEKKVGYNRVGYKLFIDSEKAYDSVRREVLYNILIEFGISLKLVRLIKMCLNETYSKVRRRKICLCISYSDNLKQVDAVSPLL